MYITRNFIIQLDFLYFTKVHVIKVFNECLIYFNHDFGIIHTNEKIINIHSIHFILFLL